jgi:hypothetical protein
MAVTPAGATARPAVTPSASANHLRTMFGFKPFASDTADSDIPGWRHAATMDALNEAA